MPMKRWNISDSDELYSVSRWGSGYFSIGEDGHLQATPTKNSAEKVDLYDLIQELDRRGIETPVLIRFDDILGRRIKEIRDAFSAAIKEYEYKGAYRPVVPIKVNQQKHVVEQLVERGREFHLGLEAGSKAELLAAIAMIRDPDATIICNGYKDLEYLETAALSCKLGLNTIVIVDRFDEIESLIRLKNERNLRGPIGVRLKLSARGAGRWAESGGEASKFGLSMMEVMRAVDRLREEGMVEQLRAIHFHIGSQITTIRAVIDAVKEASRVFVDLYSMGVPIDTVDIGGGLAVDYDGSKTNFAASMNYSLDEYAADVISEIASQCEKAGVPHPTILSESGRALTAYHSVLVFDVLGVNQHSATHTEIPAPEKDDHELLTEIRRIADDINGKNIQESFHDLVEVRDRMLSLYILGYIDLVQRAKVEEVFWDAARRIDATAKSMDYVPEDLERLSKRMYDTYYCNFSVFQSLPDAWAVDSLFPIVPIHRLDEKPTQSAILADLTCDSDGKIARFIDLRDVKSRLPLHKLNDETYYLGVFLVGAYQETLGDLHNLFGDTHVAHVSIGDDGKYRIDQVIEGDSVADVLQYVEYDPKELIARVRKSTEASVREGRMTSKEVKAFIKRFTSGLSGYTYLEGEDELS